jgi:hypothetical protein
MLKSFLWRHAGSQVLFDQPLDVIAKLLIQLLLDATRVEERSSSEPEPIDPSHGFPLAS